MFYYEDYATIPITTIIDFIEFNQTSDVTFKLFLIYKK